QTRAHELLALVAFLVRRFFVALCHPLLLRVRAERRRSANGECRQYEQSQDLFQGTPPNTIGKRSGMALSPGEFRGSRGIEGSLRQAHEGKQRIRPARPSPCCKVPSCTATAREHPSGGASVECANCLNFRGKPLIP